jgi:hypothetical protein
MPIAGTLRRRKRTTNATIVTTTMMMTTMATMVMAEVERRGTSGGLSSYFDYT